MQNNAMSEVTPVVSDSEMLRAYAETIKLKDAEIDRLKEDLWTAKQDIVALAIRRTRYESLLTRAADALEGLVWKERLHQPLIDELRKAALK